MSDIEKIEKQARLVISEKGYICSIEGRKSIIDLLSLTEAQSAEIACLKSQIDWLDGRLKLEPYPELKAAKKRIEELEEALGHTVTAISSSMKAIEVIRKH